MESLEEQHSARNPQIDHENPQCPQEEEEEEITMFQVDPDHDSDHDSALTDAELMKILTRDLQSLVVEAVNATLQNPILRSADTEEVEINQADPEAIASKQAFDLEKSGVSDEELDGDYERRNEVENEGLEENNTVGEEGLDYEENGEYENAGVIWNDIEGVNMVSLLEPEYGENMRSPYPLRPDAEDCTYFLKTGTCKFGSNCMYNHPLGRRNQAAWQKANQGQGNPEWPRQIECKYYLTPMGCKFGKACRYNHSRGRKTSVSPILEFNFLGLPIRPCEKECPYYMRTGSCKYGSNCRLNHPHPTSVRENDSWAYANARSFSQSTTPSWFLPTTINGMFSPTQGSELNRFQAPIYPTFERRLPTCPAFATNNPMAETHLQQKMGVEEFPERPGEPSCSFFLKTGDCKYKFTCKFHHPKDRFPTSITCTVSSKGLPLRPDQDVCRNYNLYGTCKFGRYCKYDHPENQSNHSVAEYDAENADVASLAGSGSWG